MTGWKTWASGIGMILTGVAMLVKSLADGALTMDVITQAATMITGGLGVIGIGHKLEKTSAK